MPDLVLLTRDVNQESVNSPDVITIVVPFISPAPTAVQVCADIHQRNPRAPIVIVAEGDLAELLPSVALAQRSAHRAVAGYVLISPTLGPPGLDWPDAPVLILSSDDADERMAKLRGWSFERITNGDQVMPHVRMFASRVTPI